MPAARRPTTTAAPAPSRLTVAEVAAHLRVSARKVYNLVARNGLPHGRAGGKLLFDLAAIEQWLSRSEGAGGARALPPPTLAGSHDLLLDWAVRESRCGLAVLTQGSTDGLARLARGEASAALTHLPSADLQSFNLEAARERLSGRDAALVAFARRDQGLLVARGNPRKVKSVRDLTRRGVSVALRQMGAGSAVLLEALLAREGLAARQLKASITATSESDLALAIRSGQADAGLGARAAARAAGLDFVPLLVEQLDLAVSRAAWFEPPLQALAAFARSRAFSEQAKALGGYDVSDFGAVRWNDSGA